MTSTRRDQWPEVGRLSLDANDLAPATAPISDKWSEIRSTILTDPAAKERYERKLKSAIAVRRMLQLIDAQREQAGMSKSALARKIGVSAATVRRLFTSPTSNPTLKTIVDLFTALDLEIDVRPRNTVSANRESREFHQLDASRPSAMR